MTDPGLVLSGPSRVLRRAAIAFSLLLVVTISAVAQTEPTPTPLIDNDDKDNVVRVKTDLVTLTLTVTDVYGRFVSGLKKDAFTVYDNGEQQDITFFSDTDAPVSIGIIFDVSGSMNSAKIAKARSSARKVYQYEPSVG